MAEATESLSVYHYAGNNPIMANDPMGDKMVYDTNPFNPGFNQQVGNVWTERGVNQGFTPNYSSSQYSDYLDGLNPGGGGGSDDVDPITAKAREKGQTIYGNANVKAFFDAIWNGPGVKLMSSATGATWMEYNDAEANNYGETRGDAGMIYYYDNKGGLDGNITAKRLPKVTSQEGSDIGLESIGTSLDELSKIKSSVGIFTQRMNFGYYAKGWGGSQYVNTFKLGKVFSKMSTGLSIYATGKSYYDIAYGKPSVLTYTDATVGTFGLLAKFASYFTGTQYPVIGEGVAIYGTVRVGWDIGRVMGVGNAEYLESARKEGCGICTLPH